LLTITCPASANLVNGECKCINSNEVIRDNKCVVYTEAMFYDDINDTGTIPTKIGLLTQVKRIYLCK
jgi:hypothetical protein